MNKLIFLIVPLLLMLAPSLVFGFGMTNTTDSIFGDQKALSAEADSILRHANSAELHGNMTAHNMYVSQNNVLVCIINTLLVNDSMSGLSSMNALGCDQTIVGNIVHHDLGNNQTIITLAMQYLKARGIQ